jgi:isopentenyl-diphosphate delta-isomerase
MTEQRKAAHVDIVLGEDVRAAYDYWNDVQLIHNALPEVDIDDIDLTTKVFGRELKAPLVISSMTGGFGGGREVNANLAAGAAEAEVAMGVGSQRQAIEDPALKETYAVIRDYGVPLRIANLGAPQFVPQKGKAPYGLEEAHRAVEMVDAHVLAIHLNYLQEVVQPEGDRRARGAIEAIASIASEIPVLAKETGAGLSREVAISLKEAGVAGLDVGGLGGTSFSAVEHFRAKEDADPLKERLGVTFWNWGIPTPVSVLEAQVGLPILATGGIRNGLDAARAVALGADAAGMASGLLKAAKESSQAVVDELNMIIGELRAALFLTGSASLDEIRQRKHILRGPSAEWVRALEERRTIRGPPPEGRG